jgi:membrane protease YdiL (CAAX protease family)
LVAVGTGVASTQPATTSIPLSSLIIIIISAFSTAVTEETVIRGYILDRLMPAHPSTLRQSLNAVIITSVMMMSYHAAPYINSYGYPLSLTAVSLVSVFVYSIFLSFAYVRSRVRNASGPILFHFLLDAGFYIVLFALVG